MIDIHTHILPGLDDGAGTLEDAVAMVQAAAAAGTTDMVATPHANPQYKFDPDEVARKLAELQQAVGDVVRLHYGCEMHFTPENIQDLLAHPAKYCINHHGYLLLEFANALVPKTASAILEAMVRSGIRPIVAHPERNPVLQRTAPELRSWVEHGCLLQVTASSFFGRFGQRAEAAAHDLMSRGLVHLLASDAHDCIRRPPQLDETMQYVEKEFGAEAALRVLVENPKAVIEGLPIRETASPVSKRRWFNGIWGRPTRFGAPA
jgi:protein-tyrosine phosphatase